MKRAKLLHIFKAGRHTDTTGKVVDFSEADLHKIAAAYNPKLHEAPLVIGHPKLNAPAYGHASRLVAIGSDLYAAPSNVDPAFAEAVTGKRHFPKISSSFYEPSNPHNPKPGQYYLKHIGFLGAVPPSVKGLKEVEFADGDQGAVTLEFSEYAEVDFATLFRSLREWIISKYNLEEADKALPPGLVDWATADAAVEQAQEQATSYAEAVEGAAKAAGEQAASAVAATMGDAQVGAVVDALVKSLAQTLLEPLAAAVAAALPEADAEKTKAALTEALSKSITAEALSATVKGALAIDASKLSEAVEKAVAPAVTDALKAAAPVTSSEGGGTADHSEPTEREKELDAREAALNERIATQRRGDHNTFLMGVLKEGRRMPVANERVVDFMEHCASGEVSFGEGDGVVSALDVAKKLIQRQPKEVTLEEIARGEAEFSENDDPQQVANAAAVYRNAEHAKGNMISTADAVRHVKGM